MLEAIKLDLKGKVKNNHTRYFLAKENSSEIDLGEEVEYREITIDFDLFHSDDSIPFSKISFDESGNIIESRRIEAIIHCSIFRYKYISGRILECEEYLDY